MSLKIGDWVIIQPGRYPAPFDDGSVSGVIISFSDSPTQALLRFSFTYNGSQDWWFMCDHLAVTEAPKKTQQSEVLEQWNKTEANMKAKRDSIMRGIFSDKVPADEEKTDPGFKNVWTIGEWVTFLKTAPIESVIKKCKQEGWGYYSPKAWAETPYGGVGDGASWPSREARDWWIAFSDRCTGTGSLNRELFYR